MAKDKIYSSILDSFLDSENREPDWKELGLKEAVNSGEEVLDSTHKHVEEALNIAGHSNVAGNHTASTRLASSPEDYKNAIGDDDSLVSEVTMSLEQAEKGGTVEKKNRTDSEIRRWINQMLNEGVAPSKIAAELNKRAEFELFNRQMSSDYLNRNSGLLGFAYLEPNHYMDSCPSTYQRLASKGGSSAKSVKKIKACDGCTHFKQYGNQKTCSLYRLPVVANEKELAAVVNRMTAGVPAKSKKAALVQIANRTDQRVDAAVIARNAASKTIDANTKRAAERGAASLQASVQLDAALIQRLHVAGHSLQKIAKAATQRFGTLTTSKAIREFVASLRKEKGQIVLAKADADFLKSIGMKNEAIVGAAKCASCAAHTHKEAHKAESTEMVTRVAAAYDERTPDRIRAGQTRVVAKFDSETVSKLFIKGHALEKIYQAGQTKVGSAQATKAVREFVANLKTSNQKVDLNQLDCQFLKNKLAMQNVIIGKDKCASCTYRQGMHCGRTGGTLLSFPGMAEQTSNKKVAANAPKDGYAILNEFDLTGAAPQGDIDMTPPERAEITMNNHMDAGEIE
jgi:hypothetical protein